VSKAGIKPAYPADIRLDESSIWIYGKGGTGMRTARVLSEAGFAVDGFIDKRAHDMEGDDLPIVTLTELVQRFPDKGQVVVMICLKDVFLHEELAHDLLAVGFHRLIYKPASFLKGGDTNDVAQQVNEIYERVVEDGLPPIAACLIPWTQRIPVQLVDRFLIRDCGETVLAWVPVELVFNYPDSPDYPKCNMPLMFGLVGLYSAFLGELSSGEYEMAMHDFYLDCGEWLHRNHLGVEDKPLSGFVDSRAGVFQNLEKLVEINREFFQTNAPAAAYERGKFYLVSSGRNRVAYQIAKGYKYVPLRLAKVDYEAWCDLPMVREMEQYLSKENGRRLFAPAQHPYLVDIPCEFADYMRLFVLPAAREIVRNLYLQCVVMDEKGVKHVDFERFNEQKRALRIFEDMEDDGVLRKYFRSLGISVVSGSGCATSPKDICFWGERLKARPACRGYFLCTDDLPDWCNPGGDTGEELMFVARGLEHRYLGVRL